jgi:glycosyltransferase involved in cell wall biosynthesis
MTKISNQADIFYVSYPVKSHFFHARNREVKDRLLFIAADITPRKNPLLILKTVATLKRDFPQVSLHIAGYFSSEEFHNSLKQFIRENQIEQNVWFMGRLTVDGLVKAFEECSIFVLPSEWENLPAVVAQAMASGKPVIATRVGGVSEMIQDGITGLLVNPGDGDALTRGIEKLLRDGELRSTMGRTAREETFKRFSEEVVARKTLEVYRTVLNQ